MNTPGCVTPCGVTVRVPGLGLCSGGRDVTDGVSQKPLAWTVRTVTALPGTQGLPPEPQGEPSVAGPRGPRCSGTKFLP